MATLPTVPQSLEERLSWFKKMDLYLNDHFGLRMEMIKWNNALRFHIFGDVNAVQLTAGKNGYLFFNSHSAQHPLSMIHFLCGRQSKADDFQQMAKSANEFMQLALSNFSNSYLLIVPTKPIVYQEQLPDWLREQCAGFTPPVAEVIAQLRRETNLKNRIIYPLAEMRSMALQHDIYTRPNFHWVADGPHPVAQLVASNYFHLPKTATLSTLPKNEPSDMQGFLPGVRLENNVNELNYQDAGITECKGGICFPEFAPFADKIGDMSRYTQINKKGKKLLIISDSFGQGISGMFSEYFSEVWHISTNSFTLLSNDELRMAKEISFQQFQPDYVLYVFHDASIGYFNQNMKMFITETKH